MMKYILASVAVLLGLLIWSGGIMTFLSVVAAYLYMKLTMVTVLAWVTAGVSACIWAFFWVNKMDLNKDEEEKSYCKNIRTTSHKLAIIFLVVAAFLPSKETLKVMAATGGVVWVITDEGVQEAVKAVTTEAGEVAKAMVTQAVSAAKGSGDTLGLVNKLIQAKLKQGIEGATH